MDTIWKFPFMGIVKNDGEGEYFDLQLAQEAVPLSVQSQRLRDGRIEPQMWVRTPDEAILPTYPTPKRRFYICGTGYNLHPKAGKHLDTFQMHDGALVFHVFEEKDHA